MGPTKCGMTLVGRGDFQIAKGIARQTTVPLHELMRPSFQLGQTMTALPLKA